MRSVWKYSREARAEKRQQQLQEQQRHHPHAASSSAASADSSTLQAVMSAASDDKLGVCFSGAGFGGAYQLGAALVLEQLGLLSSSTPVAGEGPL
jgi:hypothetical protein